MKILKFGGTSVGSVESIQTLLNILKEEVNVADKPVIVLSAMSGVTNLLINMAEEAAKGNDFAAQLADLEKRHFDVVKGLLEIRDQNPALTRLKINFNSWKNCCKAF
jgi:aspartokinase/homoserine dehydrogenase 1